MSGVLHESETGRHPSWYEFAEPTTTPVPGCWDMVLDREYFAHKAPWPLEHSPGDDLIAWLAVTGLRHEFHVGCVEYGDHISPITGRNWGEGADVTYFIRFFDQTDASAYRLIFE